MNNEEMIELLNKTKVGSFIEIEIKCLEGTCKEVGKYKGELKQNGYICKRSGGWSLYQSEGDIPCYQFLFTPKGKRKEFIMQIGYKVIGIRQLENK